MLQRCAYWAKLNFFLVGAFHAILLWYAPLKICIKTQNIIYGVMINPLRILLLFLLRVSIFESTCCHLFDNSHLPNIVNFSYEYLCPNFLIWKMVWYPDNNINVVFTPSVKINVYSVEMNLHLYVNSNAIFIVCHWEFYW